MLHHKGNKVPDFQDVNGRCALGPCSARASTLPLLLGHPRRGPCSSCALGACSGQASRRPAWDSRVTYLDAAQLTCCPAGTSGPASSS